MKQVFKCEMNGREFDTAEECAEYESKLGPQLVQSASGRPYPAGAVQLYVPGTGLIVLDAAALMVACETCELSASAEANEPAGD